MRSATTPGCDGITTGVVADRASDGWLRSDVDLSLSFTNPFSARTLKFPSISTDELELDFYPYDRRIQKAIVSKDPTLFPNDYLVVAIHYDYLRFSCFKPGDEHWVEIQDKGLSPFSDVIIFNGSIYAISFYGGLGALDITTQGFDFDDNIQSKLRVLVPNRMEYANIAYLVKSSQGQLLHVRRFITYFGESKYTTWKFDVFVLRKDDDDDDDDDEGKAMKWVEVKSLGEDALFLGDNYSMSVLTSSVPNCYSNSIYYTDNYHGNGYANTKSYDMGIYNLGDASFIAHYVVPSHYVMPSSHQDVPPPIWIQLIQIIPTIN